MISQSSAPVAVECEDTGECAIINLATYVHTYHIYLPHIVRHIRN